MKTEVEKCDGAFLEDVEWRWEFRHIIDAYSFPRLLALAKKSPRLQIENEQLQTTKLKIGQVLCGEYVLRIEDICETPAGLRILTSKP